MPYYNRDLLLTTTSSESSEALEKPPSRLAARFSGFGAGDWSSGSLGFKDQGFRVLGPRLGLRGFGFCVLLHLVGFRVVGFEV